MYCGYGHVSCRFLVLKFICLTCSIAEEREDSHKVFPYLYRFGSFLGYPAQEIKFPSSHMIAKCKKYLSSVFREIILCPSLQSAHLIQKMLIVVIPHGPTHLVVVHVWSVLVLSPQSSESLRVHNLEHSLFLAGPSNDGRVFVLH